MARHLERFADDATRESAAAARVSAKFGPMLPETRQLLQDFYEPFNQALAELVGDQELLYDHSSTAGA